MSAVTISIKSVERNVPIDNTVPATAGAINRTQECKLGVAGKYRRFWKLSGSPGLFFYLTQ